MNKKLVLFLIIIASFAIFLPKNTSADMAAKIRINVDILYNGESITDESKIDAKILECFENESTNKEHPDIITQLNINEYDSTKNCYWRPTNSPWSILCTNNSCRSYGNPPEEFKLAIYVPSLSKVFITNEISYTNSDSHYRVDLSTDGSAIISSITSKNTPTSSKNEVISFVEALLITIILEFLTSSIFLLLFKLSSKIIISTILANLISFPIAWFIASLVVGLYGLLPITILEIFVILFEAYFIHRLNKQNISFKWALVLSILNNIISLFVGAIIYIIFAPGYDNIIR